MECVRDKRNQSGLTLIELMVVIAIMVVVAAIAVPDWVMEITQSNAVRAVTEGQAAIRALTFDSLAGQGAVLQQSSTALTISANSGAYWNAAMPKGWTLHVNDSLSPLKCVSLNGMGQPTADTTSPACPVVPANQMKPLQWSVQHANQTIPLS
jgi:prepilin-type N-terminal cleavage/methylation domain